MVVFSTKNGLGPKNYFFRYRTVLRRETVFDGERSENGLCAQNRLSTCPERLFWDVHVAIFRFRERRNEEVRRHMKVCPPTPS